MSSNPSTNSIIVISRNTVRESIHSGQAKKIFVLARLQNDPVIMDARKANLPVELVSSQDLDRLTKSHNHQGFAALVMPPHEYSLRDLIEGAKGKENPLLLMLDGIEDPQNLGAILRSADAFGVDGIIIKKRGEVPLNTTVARVSTGAIHYLRIACVSNLSSAIETLKKNGYWIVASDGAAQLEYDEVDYKGPIVLIVGSEGFGISNLVLRNSDFIIKIPMMGHVNSLNASVATGILLASIQNFRKR